MNTPTRQPAQPSAKPFLKIDLDYNAVRLSIVNAIMFATGLDQNHVIVSEPELPDVPRPTLPYIDLKITTPGARFGDDDKRTSVVNGQQITNSGGPRQMSVGFNSFGTSHENAYNLMALWQSALDEASIQEMLRQSGIAVWTIGAVADLSQLMNTAYEGRAHLDCTFGLAANVSSNLGEIDQVTVSGRVDVDGTTVVSTSETVTTD